MALDEAIASLNQTAEFDCVVADVSVKADLQQAADATLDRFGRVDILMNNVGIGVSVLCPGFVRTKINHSERCLPERFASAFPDVGSAANSLSAEEFAYYAKRNEESLDPEFEGAVDARCSEIKAAFERVRSY